MQPTQAREPDTPHLSTFIGTVEGQYGVLSLLPRRKSSFWKLAYANTSQQVRTGEDKIGANDFEYNAHLLMLQHCVLSPAMARNDLFLTTIFAR